MTAGEAIRLMREARGFTLRAFATQLGVSPTFWSHVERDLRPLPESRADRAAELLELPPAVLTSFARVYTRQHVLEAFEAGARMGGDTSPSDGDHADIMRTIRAYAERHVESIK